MKATFCGILSWFVVGSFCVVAANGAPEKVYAGQNTAAELATESSNPKVPLAPVDEKAIAAALQKIKAQPKETAAGLKVLYDNGPLVNAPGAGAGGADASMLQSSSLGMSTIGFGHQLSVGNRIADDFTVTGSSWKVSQILFFAYQTGSPLNPSTMTGVYLQIWNGPPNDPGSTVVWGDLTTNRLLSSGWSGIYRVTETTMNDTTRPVMRNMVEVNATLPPGTYWLDWTVTGSLTSGPWAPPITITNQTTTGNALQFTSSSGAWNNALDSATLTQQGFPFVIFGNDFSWILMMPAIMSGAEK